MSARFPGPARAASRPPGRSTWLSVTQPWCPMHERALPRRASDDGADLSHIAAYRAPWGRHHCSVNGHGHGRRWAAGVATAASGSITSGNFLALLDGSGAAWRVPTGADQCGDRTGCLTHHARVKRPFRAGCQLRSMSIIPCGASELALRGGRRTNGPSHPGIGQGWRIAGPGR